MKKVIRLTESDLSKIIKRVINEEESQDSGEPQQDYENMKKLFGELNNVLSEYEFLHARDVLDVINAIREKYQRKYVLTMYS